MSGTKLTIGASQDILLTKQDRFYTIRETDWNRLKRLVSSCKISIEWWSIAASVFFSFSGSAVLQPTKQPLPIWAKLEDNSIDVKNEHLLNALSPNLLTECGNTIWDNKIQQLLV